MWLILIFLAHDVLLVVATALPLVYRPTFFHTNFPSQRFFWFEWDTLWFSNIGKYGYTHLPGYLAYKATAFFPLVPIMVRVFGQWGVLVIEQFLFVITMVLLKHFAERMGLTHSQAIRTAWLFALNPAAIYYSTIYAEPWTIISCLCSFFLAVRKHWILAGFAGALAAMSQGTGILVGIFPLVLFIDSIMKRNYEALRGSLIWGIGCAVGLIAYMTYLGYAYHQPMEFARVQTTIWKSHWDYPWDEFIWGVQSVMSGSKIILVYAMIALIDIAGIVLFCVRKQHALHKWEGTAAVLYTVAGTLVSLCFVSGVRPFWSTVRFLSMYFPIYIGWGIRRTWIVTTTLILFTAVSFLGTSYFTHGYFFQ